MCFSKHKVTSWSERAYQRGIRLGGKDSNPSRGQGLLLLNLATLYLESGQRPAYAEALCRRALKHAIEVEGPGSTELGNFLYILAVARQQQGDRKDAWRLFKQAYELAGGGREGELRQGLVLGNLAFLSALDHKWSQARESLLESIVVMEPSLGPSHPDLIRTHLNLARVYAQLHHWALASASAARAREITEMRLSPTHPLLAEILRTSASILRKTGRGQEARDLIRQAEAIANARPKDPASQAWVHIADLMKPARRY